MKDWAITLLFIVFGVPLLALLGPFLLFHSLVHTLGLPRPLPDRDDPKIQWIPSKVRVTDAGFEYFARYDYKPISPIPDPESRTTIPFSDIQWAEVHDVEGPSMFSEEYSTVYLLLGTEPLRSLYNHKELEQALESRGLIRKRLAYRRDRGAALSFGIIGTMLFFVFASVIWRALGHRM